MRQIVVFSAHQRAQSVREFDERVIVLIVVLVGSATCPKADRWMDEWMDDCVRHTRGESSPRRPLFLLPADRQRPPRAIEQHLRER